MPSGASPSQAANETAEGSPADFRDRVAVGTDPAAEAGGEPEAAVEAGGEPDPAAEAGGEPEAAVEVAVPAPVFGTFTYLVPRRLLRPGEGTIPPGSRVRAPFSGRTLVGVVLGPATARPAGGTKPLAARFDDPSPAIPADLLALAPRVAELAIAPLGVVLRAMLPPASAAPAGRAVRVARLTAEGRARLSQPDPGPPRAARGASVLHDDDRRILTLLELTDGDVPASRIRRELGLRSTSRIQRLEREGLLRLSTARIQAGPSAVEADAALPSEGGEEAGTSEPPRLSEAQRRASLAVAAAIRNREFGAFLLHGVTGSGKTEVYLDAAARCLEAGRSVLLLVPEISLAPRMERLLRRRFGSAVGVAHSGLTAAERRAAFWRVRSGAARIVVGARSASLAPLRDLGLVVVDEEHDGAYKQDETPRYHARQVAWLRARAAGAALVLGSATPSLEVAAAADRGRVATLRLPERVGGRPLPSVRLVDMRPVLRAALGRGKTGAAGSPRGPLVFSPELAEALAGTARAGRQALILLNRRGWGGRLVCLGCGAVLECPRCAVALTLHRRGHLAVCHACGLGRPTPRECATCAGEILRSEGFGTERVLEELRRLLPDVPAARFDRDATRARGSHARILDPFAAGDVRMLVGTQMLAKGHDFPSVGLVGVIAADAGLGIPDFRAAERTFQLITQVAGRAGRGDAGGRVLVQTMNPEHYAIASAARQDHAAFREVEMESRRQFRYPPFRRLIRVVAEDRSTGRARAEALSVVESVAKGEAGDGVEAAGPGLAPAGRDGTFRWQILLRVAPGASSDARSFLRRKLGRSRIRRRLWIDADPESFS